MRMLRRIRLKRASFNNGFTFVILVMGIVLTACAGKKMATPAAPVVLGAVYSLTGNKSDMGVPAAKGARMAVEQINDAGGIHGRKLDLVLKDGQSDSAAVGRAVDAIVNEHPDTLALFGLVDTDLARSAGVASAASQRLFLTSGATSPLLPGQVPGYLYLACFGDNIQAAAAAEWAWRKHHARTATVVYDSDETYTVLLQRYFIDRFRSLGGRVLAVQAYHSSDISRLGQGVPPADVVFLSAGSAEDAQKGITILRNAGVTVPILGGDGFDSEAVWEAHPEVNGVYYTTHAYLGADSPDPDVRKFGQAYNAAYGGNIPDAFAALGYDTVNLLASAIRRARAVSPEGVLEALSTIDDFQGVTGAISFAGGRRIPRKSVTIIHVEKGRRHFMTTFMPQIVPKP